ncbi:electron transfer protein with DM13 domain [Xenococcus sp. PCC 7305]|uniref:DM13 domain-containing protein n=1 Tax=Xenococcus sp. PCC 7305 TaxID=102125 RepID=UPI0002AC2ACD|nr:DM13 domain-containing protein [Xenococcus sp. PCC 7305]ELS04201.1 electron transfer protein with DM13 domain [Xenococcus sp. PCC 7305]
MNFPNLRTFSLASVLLVTTIGSFGNALELKAESSTLLNSPIVIAQATENNNFVSVGRKTTKGQIEIATDENGQKYIEFDQSFVTDQGPDLKVILHRKPSVSSRISESDYIEIAPLESFSGTQRYLIPDDVDLSEYAAVAIWCRQFNVTFGYATVNIDH